MVAILQKAPDFRAPALIGTSFGEVALADHLGKWVLLFFYPLDFTYVCPTEILELSRREPELKALGVQVIAASCDSQFSHKAWIDSGIGELRFPLVSDFTKEIARSYGALLDGGFPARATFLIDPQGVLQYACYHNPNVGRSINETMRVVEAVQTGGLTPVEWKRGDKTLQP